MNNAAQEGQAQFNNPSQNANTEPAPQPNVQTQAEKPQQQATPAGIVQSREYGQPQAQNTGSPEATDTQAQTSGTPDALSQAAQRSVNEQAPPPSQEPAPQASAPMENNASPSPQEAQDAATLNVSSDAGIVRSGEKDAQSPANSNPGSTEQTQQSQNSVEKSSDIDLKALFKDFDPVIQGSSIKAFNLFFAHRALSGGDPDANRAAADALKEKLVDINNAAINPSGSKEPDQEQPTT